MKLKARLRLLRARNTRPQGQHPFSPWRAAGSVSQSRPCELGHTVTKALKISGIDGCGGSRTGAVEKHLPKPRDNWALRLSLSGHTGRTGNRTSQLTSYRSSNSRKRGKCAPLSKPPFADIQFWQGGCKSRMNHRLQGRKDGKAILIPWFVSAVPFPNSAPL
jgi:hypothetical protein